MREIFNFDAIPEVGSRYSLEECLGRGVYGKVFRAKDTQAGQKKVAIKIQKFTQENEPFIQEEYRILRDVSNHPNLPEFYGIYKLSTREKQEIWFAMELCEGGPVTDLVKGLMLEHRRMAEEHIAVILKEVVKALTHLHDNKVLHRDIRANNILLTKEGDIKLVDFGLSRLLKSTLGKTTSSLGSPCWMAPEVVKAQDNHDYDGYDNRADVWSLGITALELGDGQTPFQDMHPTRAMFQIVRNPPPTLNRPGNWSANFNDFINECLVKNAEHRPYMMELLEHPFLSEIPENNYYLTQELKVMYQKYSASGSEQRVPEFVVHSNLLKKGEDEELEQMQVEDLSTLEELNEESILRELNNRTKEGQPCTFIGDILLVLNPNEQQDIYRDEHHRRYRFKSRSDNAPHIYSVADSAYQAALHHQTSQHILLAGESSSGKTTNYLHIVDHLLYLGQNNNINQERIRNGIKLLHAFIHASTPTNDYSTRCVFHTEIVYGSSGKNTGARFEISQIEKWRVSSTDMSQSNFHIMYYFYDGIEETGELTRYHLDTDVQYRYLRASHERKSSRPRDNPKQNAKKYEKILEILKEFDFDAQQIESIFNTLAAIINLGEVRFQENSQGKAEVLNAEVSRKVAQLLKVEEKKFLWSLTNYCIVNEKMAVRKHHSCEQARDARDVLANTLYSRVAQYIVNVINHKLSYGIAIFGEKYSIKILDFYGFESFKENALSQLLVNCTNELLQYHYLQRVFGWEALETNEENIPYKPIYYYDNKEALEEMLGKFGVLNFIDEASKHGRGGKYVLERLQSLEKVYVNKLNDSEFCVNHYTGKVIYYSNEMPDRNRDFLPPEIIQILRTSNDPVVKLFFTSKLNKAGNLCILFEKPNTQETTCITEEGVFNKIQPGPSRSAQPAAEPVDLSINSKHRVVMIEPQTRGGSMTHRSRAAPNQPSTSGPQTSNADRPQYGGLIESQTRGGSMTHRSRADPNQPSTSGPQTSNANRAQYDGLIAPQEPRTADKGLAMQYLSIMSEGSKIIKKFNIEAKTLTFKFNDTDESANPILWLQKALDELISRASAGSDPSDKIGMVLRNDNFPEKPVCFSFRRVDQLSSAVMLATLEKILQSNSAFFANDTLRLHVDRITLPVGYGRRLKMTGVSYEEFCARRQGILVVRNVDNLCLARALVLAMAWRSNDAELEFLEAGGFLMQRRASALCASAGVNLDNGGTREHVEQFQDFLTTYTIVVYNHRAGKTVYYEGPRAHDRVALNLILENQHYNVITNLTSTFACAYFCELCRARFSHKEKHKNCPYICPSCHVSPPCFSLVEMIKCNSCNRDFYGPGCFNEHKKSLCTKLQRCLGCFRSVWVNPKKTHRCNYSYCSTCQGEKPVGHFCFMAKKPPVKAQMEKFFIFVFYDLECLQEKPVDGVANAFEHEPNLCVAQNMCKSCINDSEITQDCDMCGKRQHVFKTSPVKSFLNYVSKLGNNGTHVIALAHNMKGYDGLFILNELVKEQSKWDAKIISTGTKIMSITCGNIKFIDSLNFMAMPLSELPATFKFPGTKGYFPFLFNTEANQNYVGQLPPVEYYCPDEMKPKARDNFLKWHTLETANGTVFDMQRDIVKYCITDVEILRKACLEFWKIFTRQNSVDPFRETCTIAGACMTVFRRNFLQEGTIGLIPHGGYRMGDKQSIIGLKWLLWVEHVEGIQIQHAGNGREKRLGSRILVDGYCEATNTVYNFHGCYFHGCPRCYPDQTVDLAGLKGDTMGLRHEKTVAVSSKIRDLGYTLVEMWECDFKKFLNRSPPAAEFVAANAIQKNTPLNPRDAFFGGRTNAVKLHHEVANDEDIKYFDVCSLYPYVNKYGKYPVGHPTIYVGDAACRQLNFDSINGLIKATVLPPNNLYHPVLPHRLHNKLMFILCRTCAETMSQNDCAHDVDERKFTGTYVSDELQKAVEVGYQVLEFHEVWVYKIVQYDRGDKRGGLFSEYVDTFLKLKQECSGWPSWCVTEELKDQYIEQYLDQEGIALDKNNIGFNAGFRYIAKLILNSFWGKLGQRENLNQTSIITESYDFFKMLTDPSIEIQSLITPNDDTVIVNWVRHDESVQPLKTVNVVMAAYTTASARLELYKYLETLDRRVLYFDTDSVFFTQRPGEWCPPTGDFLGDLTDEMAEGSKISTFISGGPKNYAYKFNTKDGETDFVCKVKGITLNYKNSKKVNFDVLKDMVLNGLESTYVETDRKIVRTSNYKVLSKPEKKIYRVQYTKRRRIDDAFDTLPYGYKV